MEANRTVEDLMGEIIQYWNGSWVDVSDREGPHEAGRLHLQIDKAHHELGWKPQWDFGTTVKRTVRWYQSVENGETALKACIRDIEDYGQSSDYKKVLI